MHIIRINEIPLNIAVKSGTNPNSVHVAKVYDADLQKPVPDADWYEIVKKSAFGHAYLLKANQERLKGPIVTGIPYTLQYVDDWTNENKIHQELCRFVKSIGYTCSLWLVNTTPA